MTSFLTLAHELFERATNPAHGVVSNDEHAARLADAIGPEDEERFAAEVARLADPASLTSHGWAWVLDFAIGHQVVLDRDLLLNLCQRWDEPALKALVIEAAIDPDMDGHSQSSDEQWLTDVIERATPQEDDQPPEDQEADSDEADSDEAEPPASVETSSAEALLTALLIVGSPPSLAAARRLMERDWPGAQQLAEFLTDRVEDTDPLARAPWVEFQS